MRAQVGMVALVASREHRIFDRSVRPRDLPIGPEMIGPVSRSSIQLASQIMSKRIGRE